MDTHSKPVTAAAAYDLVLSDDLMSPELEVASYDPHVREIDKNVPLLSTILPTMSTAQSMENVLLDNLPMDESIDLGGEHVLDQSVHSAASVTRESEATVQETDDSVIKIDQVEAPDEQSSADDTIKDHFDNVASASDNLDLLDGNQEISVIHGSTKDDAITVHVTEVQSKFESIVNFLEEKSPEPDDAHEVEFMEEKGLQPAESSRSLCKFFENDENVGGTDVEGKSFFDSFTTGDEDPITSSATLSPKILEPASTLPPLSMPHVSLTSSVSSAGATPSPVHRISESSSPCLVYHQTSTPETDPFSTGLFTNDVDRRHDAWIPSESTRLMLLSVFTNSSGTPLPNLRTCSPHIIVEESLVCMNFFPWYIDKIVQDCKNLYTFPHQIQCDIMSKN